MIHLCCSTVSLTFIHLLVRENLNSSHLHHLWLKQMKTLNFYSFLHVHQHLDHFKPFHSSFISPHPAPQWVDGCWSLCIFSCFYLHGVVLSFALSRCPSVSRLTFPINPVRTSILSDPSWFVSPRVSSMFLSLVDCCSISGRFLLLEVRGQRCLVFQLQVQVQGPVLVLVLDHF